MSDAPLSPEDLTSLVYSLTTDVPFVERDTEYEQQRLLVYQQRPINLPGVKLKTQFHDPSLEDNAHQFKNRMLAAPIRINVAAKSLADRAVEKARNQEKFYYRYYRHWEARQKFDAPLYDMAAFSIGWVYLTINWELIPDLPDVGKGESNDDYCTRIRPIIAAFQEEEQPDLFEIDSARPNTMYWTPGRDYICHRSYVPYTTLASEYAKKGTGLNVNADGEIEIATIEPGVNVTYGMTHWNKRVEFFIAADDDYIYHCIQGGSDIHLLGTYPNLFGRPPFFPVEAEITGDSHPLYNTRALIQPLYQTAPYRNLAINAKLTAGLDTAQQRYVLEKVNPDIGDSDEMAIEVAVVNGMLLPPPGYKITNPGIATGPDLRDAIELINAEHGRYGMPKSLGHPDEVTASSGYERARQEQTVANLLDPPLGHFAAMLGFGVFPAMATAVKALGVEMTVRNIQTGQPDGNQQSVQDSVTIKPDDIIDAEIQVDFSSISSFDLIARQEEALKMMAADMEHETEFLTDAKGVDDVPAWRKQRDYDKLDKHASERALTDALAAVDALRAQYTQEAQNQAGLPTMLQNSDLNRPDRGPSIASGPGQAMPVVPTPPGMGGPQIPVGPMPVPTGVPGSPMPGVTQ